MNFIYSFIIFEAGAFSGFFVAALLNAARAGQENCSALTEPVIPSVWITP